MIRIGNAPCSWGTLEFEGTKGEPVPYGRMLDELAETGYTGTELGDWGYMPTDPAVLREELGRRGLVMLGAFVPVALKDPSAHEAGVAGAVKTARLLAAVASEPKPYLVLADNNGTVPERTKNAGRITSDLGLTAAQWKVFGDGANKVARAVMDETGLDTVFHHHCAGFVETAGEIDRLLDNSDVSLVFDTGHFAFGNARFDVENALKTYQKRTKYVHLKDCSPAVAARAAAENQDYFEALRHGVFCELGQGGVNFAAVLQQLKDWNYSGYVLVEQDVLPGMGAPRESARRNREYLRRIQEGMWAAN